MELSQKLTFQRKRSKYVASPLRDDLPWHRITLRVQDRHPALRVTSHFVLSSPHCRDDAGYAFGVRHVAPSPPGWGTSPGGRCSAPPDFESTTAAALKMIAMKQNFQIFKINRSDHKFVVKIDKFFEKYRFFIFFIFSKNFANFVQRFFGVSSNE